MTKKQADGLRASIEHFGFAVPFLVSPDGDIYDGHQRQTLMGAIKDYGPNATVDVRVSSRPLTDDERRELVVRLKQNQAGWDFDMLPNLYEREELLEWGFEPEELGMFPDDDKPDDPGVQIDKAEELREKWGVEAGQLWQLGEHRLICGDCTDAVVVARAMGGERAGLVFADPPYGVNIVAANVSVGGGEGPGGMIPFGGVKGFQRLGSVGGAKPFGTAPVRGSDGASNIVAVGKYAPVIGDETTDTAIKAATLFLKEWPDAVQVWWGGNYYVEALGSSSCWLVWNKETTGNFADCELAWTNQDKAAKLFTHKWNGMLRDSERGRRWHPTQKPAALAVWAFELLGSVGDVIFDPFCGAGMSIIAGEQSNRQVRAIEMSADYCAVAIQRWVDMTGGEPVLLDS